MQSAILNNCKRKVNLWKIIPSLTVICRMIQFKFLVSYVYLFWVAFSLCSANGNEILNNTGEVDFDNYTEDDFNMVEFCNEANLRTLIFPDSEHYTITVTFELSDMKFKECFTNYVIFLEKARQTINSARVFSVHGERRGASHKFYNITCGVYEIVIQPCYSESECAYMRIRHPISINMTSANCLSGIFIYDESSIKEIIIPTAIFLVLVILAISVLVYFLIKRKRNGRISSESDFGALDYCDKKFETALAEVKKIHVYIFHYYDEENVVKSRVETLRDFLVQSSYYSSVKVINGELPEILINPNDWLSKALKEKSEDEGIIKIIIIDAKEDNMGKEYETENLIYIQAIETLYNDACRSRTDYDTIFVVRLKDTPAYSDRIKRIVRGHRYSIPDHLINLCINLCSGSGLDLSTVEEELSKLFLNHPIQHLGVDQNV